jgi:uncharacterized ubiquitin-like protein YukD
MAEMTLILETLSNMPLTDCSFPSDMTAREVADDIANQLNYPVVDPETNEPISFYLLDGKGKRLDDNVKLEDAGLRNGDTIKIQSSKNFTPPPPPIPPQGVVPVDGQISLWIKLINQNRNVFEQFDPNTRVSDLLGQMIAKYDLPAHYPSSNEPIVYVVSSKSQGRQLHGIETLADARISNMDTLHILTDNKAGGGHAK